MVAVITTRRGPKPFAWSYSKLKNHESCPKRHYHIDIAKDVREEESEQLQWGNEAHKLLANRLSKNTPLPAGLLKYESWCERITGPIGAKLPPGVKLLVEQKLAITEKFGPCSFFDDGAWYRCIGDAIKIAGDVAFGGDWKTGKIVEDSVQLALMAQCIFAHYPEVQKVRTEFIWLKHDASSRADFSRADMPELWRSLWPRVEALKHAHDTMTYPAKKGRLCEKWCPVQVCPHHGEPY